MIKILSRFEKEESKEGFFVFELLDEEKKRENEALTDSSKTIFEQVALRRQKNSQNKKKKYIILASAVAIVIVCLAVLGDYLRVHQKNAPIAVCDNILSAFEEKDTEPILKYCTNLPRVLTYKKNLSNYLKEYLPQAKYEYFHTASDNKGEEKYIFKAGDSELGVIVFALKSKKASYGINSYYVKSFEMEPLTTYKIVANSTFNIRINGEAPNEKYLFSRTKIATPIEYFTENAVTKDLYYIDDLNYIADIKAYDVDGTLCKISYNADMKQYEITRSISDVRDKISEFCNGFLLEYLNFSIVDDSNKKEVLKSIHPKSSLYKTVKDFTIEESKDFTEKTIENIYLKNIECYGNNFYSCEVSADFIAIDDKKESVTVRFNKTLYFVSEEESFYIFDITEPL